MVDMGVKPYAIATSVSLIIAQRLARKLCDNCKETKDIPREALEKEGFEAEDLESGLTIFGPVGCKSCNGGYKGRVGIFQVMEVSEAMGRIIMEGGNALQIADQAASEGVIDLRRAGLNKVKEGVTSLDEVNRVTIE
jgi:type IV pilus assembly protein PilB